MTELHLSKCTDIQQNVAMKEKAILYYAEYLFERLLRELNLELTKCSKLPNSTYFTLKLHFEWLHTPYVVVNATTMENEGIGYGLGNGKMKKNVKLFYENDMLLDDSASKKISSFINLKLKQHNAYTCFQKDRMERHNVCKKDIHGNCCCGQKPYDAFLIKVFWNNPETEEQDKIVDKEKNDYSLFKLTM